MTALSLLVVMKAQTPQNITLTLHPIFSSHHITFQFILFQCGGILVYTKHYRFAFYSEDSRLHRRPRRQNCFLGQSDSSTYQIFDSVSSLNFIRRKWLQRSPCSSNLKFNTQRNCRSISKCHHIPSASIQKNLVYVKQTKK